LRNSVEASECAALFFASASITRRTHRPRNGLPLIPVGKKSIRGLQFSNSTLKVYGVLADDIQVVAILKVTALSVTFKSSSKYPRSAGLSDVIASQSISSKMVKLYIIRVETFGLFNITFKIRVFTCLEAKLVTLAKRRMVSAIFLGANVSRV
jgi:hypothetical protein